MLIIVKDGTEVHQLRGVLWHSTGGNITYKQQLFITVCQFLYEAPLTPKNSLHLVLAEQTATRGLNVRFKPEGSILKHASTHCKQKQAFL